MFRSCRFFVVLALLAAGVSSPCWGEDDRATIAGSVADSSQAVIAGVTVLVRNLDPLTPYREAWGF